MRHIRTRRRLKPILTALFIAALILFIEDRVESFVPHIKDIAASRVEAALGRRFDISIGGLDGGIVQPFILRDVKIRGKDNNPLILSALKINSIRSNYRIWDLLLKMKADWLLPRLSAKVSSVDINFSTKDDAIRGFMKLEGDMADADAKGYVAAGKEKIYFTAKMRNESFEIEFMPKNSVVRMKGAFYPELNFAANVKVNHIKVYDTDIVCDADLDNRYVKEKDHGGNAGYLEGVLRTNSLILNYAPFSDVKAVYSVHDGILDITSLNIENYFKAHGWVSLRYPYNANIVVTLDNARLNKLLSCATGKNIDFISGVINGKFEITGPITNPKTTANLEMKKGSLGSIDFEYLSASLKGDGPIVRIEDSRITRPSGYFSLAGEMDFSKIGKIAMFSGIRMVTDDTAIMWDRWDVEKTRGVQEINMKKKVSEDIDFGFKKFMLDDRVDESLNERDEFEFEYKLHPSDSLKLMFKSGGEFFGLEHKDRF